MLKEELWAMANPGHLQILMDDVDTWNAWRNDHQDVAPDLREAHLSRVNLSRVNLSGAVLLGANLSRADFSWSNFSRSNLYRANLSRTNLSRANLFGAILLEVDLSTATLTDVDLRGPHLGGADLRGADLTGANLTGADLTGANLSGANLSETFLNETILSNTNFTAARGLETCDHIGPSTLDHRTLAKSGPLPLAFLRGCGLPDALINFLPSLLTEPFQSYSCFISYASRDQAFAERLYADLQNKDVRCWFAPEDMKIGDKLRPRIDETIRVYDKLLLVLSEVSVASQWVEQEVETALARERQQGKTILFPVRIDNTVMSMEMGWPALIRNTRNIGDFTQWKDHEPYQRVFARLLRDLTATEKGPGG